jgi:hypothetical protein
MTLVVARVSDGAIWMVSDTAVTGGTVGTRDRENILKIGASEYRKALVAFAGDVVEGRQCLSVACGMQDHDEAVLYLKERSGAHLEFAYAFFDEDDRPVLLLIQDGNALAVSALYLGSKEAFELFQKIQLSESNHFSPKSLKLFISSAREDPPREAIDAIKTMIDCFISSSAQEVGGVPVAMFLVKQGAVLINYGYSVSDPVFDKLNSGDVVPHGTAELGGGTLSVTELGELDGVIAYWLQRRGGDVYLFRDGQPTSFQGAPTEFKSAVENAFGCAAWLWVGDQPPGQVKGIRLMRDEAGHVTSVLAEHERGMTISVVNLETPFHSEARFGSGEEGSENVKVEVDENRTAVKIELRRRDQNAIDLNTDEVDELMSALADARFSLEPPVPPEAPKGRSVIVPIDPAWRTQVDLHPELKGVLLTLRHPGFGWMSFLLPHHEARALGEWLVGSSKDKSE